MFILPISPKAYEWMLSPCAVEILDELKKMGIGGQVNENYHLSKFWADIYWSRRVAHSNREDPELDQIKKISPDSLLEIGSAYGRILRKLKALLPKTDLHGIEICPYFEDYRKEYLSGDFDEYLMEQNIVTGDFFQHDFGRKFDVILLPMNTFPSFPEDLIVPLLSRVKELLNSEGRFVFSSHRYGENSKEPSLLTDTTDYVEEIGMEFRYIQFGPFRFDGGHYYDSFHVFGEDAVFRTRRSVYKPEYLEDILHSQGAEVSTDDSSHSTVWICKWG